MTLYIDIILVENIIMNYIILFATGLIVKTNIKQFRIILACTIGSIYAVMLYVSQIGIYMNQIIKVVLSIVIVYTAFFPKNLKMLLKEIVIFYLTSFCFGGAAYYLLYYIKPVQISNINSIFTGSYPIKIAILGGIIGFIIINISFKIIKSKINKNSILYDIEIVFNNKKCSLKAVLDTGNLLVDPITAFPVVIVEKNVMEEIISKDILNNLLEILDKNNFDKIPQNIKRKCKFIPFSSIGNKNGMIIGLKPDFIKIYDDDDEIIKKDVIIGISNDVLSKNRSYSGLIGLELLRHDNVKIKQK